jgi:hypothetical protein
MEYIYTCKILVFKGHAVKIDLPVMSTYDPGNILCRLLNKKKRGGEGGVKLKRLQENLQPSIASARFKLYVTGVGTSCCLLPLISAI